MITFFLSIFFQNNSLANLPAPVIQCVSVLPNGNVSLTWNPISSSPIFTSYKIFRVNGSTLTQIGTETIISQNSFTHTGINAHNTSFRYIIGTFCSSSGITNYSDTVSSIKLNVNNPANGLAILNWNKIFTPINNVTASNTYLIYREFPIGNWVLIDSTQYGNEYYRDTITVCNDSINYKIVNKNTSCSSTSSIDGDWFQDVLPPSSPVIKNISVDKLTNKAIISWNKSTPNDTKAYIILKKIGSAWIVIDTVWGINNTSYLYNLSTAGSNSECYGIAAFDSCWYGSPLSPNTSAMGDPHCSIFASTTQSICDKTITVNWNYYSGWTAGVNKYLIYYKLNNSTEVFAGTTSLNNFTLTNIYPDSNYCFVIKGVSNDFKDTAISNFSCAVSKYPRISDTNYLQVATIETENHIKIRIYTAPNNKIKGYDIERSENGSSFSKIGFVPKSPIPISYDDFTPYTSEIKYYYRVIPIDSCDSPTTKVSNTAETIFLTTNSNSANFENTLSWTEYKTWDGNIKEYEIYRQLGTTPAIKIGTVPNNIFTYSDDISTFYSSSDNGEFCYYIQAVENTNQFGFSEKSKSNESCTSLKSLIYIPNAIYIDGYNKEFKPVIGFANFTSYSLQIFNRSGIEIFNTNDIKQAWDGKHKEKIVPNGVYIYVLLIKDSNGKPIQKSGYVTVIH